MDRQPEFEAFAGEALNLHQRIRGPPIQMSVSVAHMLLERWHEAA